MNRALDSTTHSARADMFQREASWRLGPDALKRESGEPGGSARFPYASIVEMRLCFDPHRRRGLQRPRAGQARHRGGVHPADDHVHPQEIGRGASIPPPFPRTPYRGR